MHQKINGAGGESTIGLAGGFKVLVSEKSLGSLTGLVAGRCDRGGKLKLIEDEYGFSKWCGS